MDARSSVVPRAFGRQRARTAWRIWSVGALALMVVIAGLTLGVPPTAAEASHPNNLHLRSFTRP